MADNVQVNEKTTSGAIFACASLSFSGDTAVVQCVGDGILSGSEGAWTYSLLVGGAGAVAAGVQRVTLASDDPAVVDLAAIEVLLGTIDADTSKITECNTGAVVVASGTITAVTSITNAVAVTGTFWQATQPVSGTFWQATQPVSIAGAVTVDLGANNDVTVTSGAVTATLAAETTKVIGTVNVAAGQTIAATQSGTWNVTNVSGTISLPTGAATESTLGDIKTAVQLIDNAISGAGFNITQLNGAAVPIGAGTEAAAVRVTIATDSTGVLSIDDNGGAITVDGTVTANAGTNLNTSALALETGGNLAAAATSLAVVDDWDSSDDCRSVTQGAALMDGATRATIKRISGIATSSGANTLIAAVAGYQIRVLAMSLIATSTTAVSAYVYNGDYMLFGDGTNKLTLDMDGVGGPAGFVLPWNPGGWFQTDTDNEALALNLSGATPVIWAVTYIEVT